MKFTRKTRRERNDEWPKRRQYDEYQLEVFNPGNSPKHTVDSLINYWYAKREWEERYRARVNSYINTMFRVRFMRVLVPEYSFDYLISPALNLAIGPFGIYAQAGNRVRQLFQDNQQLEINIVASAGGSGFKFFDKMVDEQLLPRYPGMRIVHAGGYSVAASIIPYLTGVERQRYNAEYTQEEVLVTGAFMMYWTYPGIRSIIEEVLTDTEMKPIKVAYLPDKPEEPTEEGIGFMHITGMNPFQYSGWFFYAPQMMSIAKDLTAKVWSSFGKTNFIIMQYNQAMPMRLLPGSAGTDNVIHLLVYPLSEKNIYTAAPSSTESEEDEIARSLPDTYLSNETRIYTWSELLNWNSRLKNPLLDFLGLSNLPSELATQTAISRNIANATRGIAPNQQYYPGATHLGPEV